MGHKTYVIYYRSPVPHIGIGFNAPVTHGFGPVRDLQPHGPGTVGADLSKPVKVVVLDTTRDQEKAMLAKILERRDNPGTYDLRSRNCAHFVEDVLEAGGIETTRTLFPGALIKELRSKGVDATAGAKQSPGPCPSK